MHLIKRLLKTLAAIAVLLIVVVIGALVFMPGIHISSLKMVLNVATGANGDTPPDTLLERLQVPRGQYLSIFASGLNNPRLLQLTPAGRLLVSSPRGGSVTQLEDTNGDGTADSTVTLIEGLNRPQGLEYRNGYLYVGESNQVGRVAYDDALGKLVGDYQVIIEGLTDDGNHWSKSLRFGPDGMLYVAMGSSCNVCEESDPRRATIMRFQADGSDGEIFASGLRNSVGLDFAPWDGSLYATDNGRDLLGDTYPPCELNLIEQGGFYGWPYLNGQNEPDPDFGALAQDLQTSAIAPVFDFRPHNAPLGIHFVQGQQRRALVALHGSWNRSEPDGYRVLELVWNTRGDILSSDFISGFERDGDIIGRPVDITGDGDSGVFVSDDYAGVIYRVSARASANAPEPEASIQAATANLPDTDPQLVADGARVYAQYPCATCHADTAMTPVSLARIPQRYTLETLTDYFLTPTPPMPQFDLSAEQREQLAHYLFSEQASAAEK